MCCPICQSVVSYSSHMIVCPIGLLTIFKYRKCKCLSFILSCPIVCVCSFLYCQSVVASTVFVFAPDLLKKGLKAATLQFANWGPFAIFSIALISTQKCIGQGQTLCKRFHIWVKKSRQSTIFSYCGLIKIWKWMWREGLRMFTPIAFIYLLKLRPAGSQKLDKAKYATDPYIVIAQTSLLFCKRCQK